MSLEKEHLKYREQVSTQYAKMYNQDSKKIGPRGAFNNLRGVREEYRENFKNYRAEIQDRLKELTPVFELQINKLSPLESDEVKKHFMAIKQLIRLAMVGENHVSSEKDEVLNFIQEKLQGHDPFKKDLKELFMLIDQFAEISLHKMELSRLIGYVKNYGFPGELKFKKAVRPSDKKDWLKAEYEAHSGDYKTEEEWAIATTKKFKDTFDTPIGSPESIKRHGKYKGLN